MAFGALLGVTILSAYAGREAVLAAVAALLLAEFGIAADPLRLLRRKVSRKSRYILAAGLLPVIVAIGWPSLRTVIVAAILLSAASLTAAVGNAHWRASETYKMSRHVLKALQPDDNTDHRDACLTAWQADGAREVVAAAAEMGAYGCEEIEWAARKAAFTIGFCRASQLTRQHEKERVGAVREAERAWAEVDALRRRLADLEDYAESFDEYRESLKAAERMATDGARASREREKTLEEIQKLQRKVEQLEEANETLVNTADNPLLAAEAAEQLTLQRLKEAAEKNMSVRQAEAYAGCSHRRAQEYLKAYNTKKQKNPKGESNGAD